MRRRKSSQSVTDERFAQSEKESRALTDSATTEENWKERSVVNCRGEWTER